MCPVGRKRKFIPTSLTQQELVVSAIQDQQSQSCPERRIHVGKSQQKCRPAAARQRAILRRLVLEGHAAQLP